VDAYLGSQATAVDHRWREAAAIYSAAVRPAFDLLLGVAAQLSAVLIASSAGSKTADVAETILQRARASHGEALETLRSIHLTVPSRHAHGHLERAATLIGAALQRARQSNADRAAHIDEILSPLRLGWNELNSASDALTGFCVLNLSQCCGAHEKRARVPRNYQSTGGG